MFMSKAKIKFRRPLSVLLTSVCCAAVALPLLAADGAGPVPTNAAQASGVQGARPSSALVNLITRLGESGALKPEETTELVKLAEADGADARVQTALTALATAQAEAAQIRSEAAALQAAAARNALAKTVSNTTSAATPAGTAKTAAAVVDAAVSPVTKQSLPEDDTVRVTYVPEVVKAQLREEIKNEVMEQARTEHWAAPRTLPDWVTRFTFFGDTRVRYESFSYPSGNDKTGAFPNFNAINTGSPFDTTGSVFSPQYNVDQSRRRTRLRARLGVAADLGENYSSGFRIATGENNSPVSQNQSFGAAGSGQGGNFSKYALWLDRAFIRYAYGDSTDNKLSFTVGRMDNPFFATTLLWADDLGFDGAALSVPVKIHLDGTVSETVRPYFVAGLFPVFNTDLNFATNEPAKFKSYDKWLSAAQLIIPVDLTRNLSLKLGAAYYSFENVEGRRSAPTIFFTSQDAGATDNTRPAFAQKGNTYIPLRDIVANADNDNGNKNQWQYYGLATTFREIAATGRLDLNYYLPTQISLQGEWVKNIALHPKRIARQAINNLDTFGAFEGSDTAWIGSVRVGQVALQKRWDWSLVASYRNVGSDALIDGFCDSDFGGGGTNLKGYTIAGALALSKRVSLGLRWMSADAVVGPPLKTDIFQFDLNAKY